MENQKGFILTGVMVVLFIAFIIIGGAEISKPLTKCIETWSGGKIKAVDLLGG